jgi:hypothetical protein
MNMRRGASLKVCCAVAVLAGVLLPPFAAVVIARAPTERVPAAELKVAYTIAFLKFLTHAKKDPRREDSLVRLCVVGEGDVADAFKRVDGMALQLGASKTLRVERAPPRLRGAALSQCWAVYVDDANQHRIPSIAKQLRGKGVLLISESKGALAKGAMLNLLHVGDKLRWEMSRSLMEAEALVMSAQVYRNAVHIE